jgi:hypothetical protein
VALAAPRTAAAATCYDVSGKFNEVIMGSDSAPNDPAGRVVGSVDGTLAGATTAIITALSPSANGNLNVSTVNAFATLDSNLLFAKGSATWLLVKNGYYQVTLTLTVTGGSGKYNNATGTINILGIGNNVGPGTGQFIHDYRGQVCVP